jgi:hypothetical protein
MSDPIPTPQSRRPKSRLGEDLEQALMLCRLRDDLAELVDHLDDQDPNRKLIYESYLKATVLLACAVVDTYVRHVERPGVNPENKERHA